MSSLRIASYNASGLLSKLDFTYQLMRDNAIDILLVIRFVDMLTTTMKQCFPNLDY